MPMRRATASADHEGSRSAPAVRPSPVARTGLSARRSSRNAWMTGSAALPSPGRPAADLMSDMVDLRPWKARRLVPLAVPAPRAHSHSGAADPATRSDRAAVSYTHLRAHETD